MAEVTFSSPTHQLLVSKLASKSAKKLTVIDYGCGEGELLHYIPHRRIKDYWGWEVNEDSIKTAKKKWRPKRFHWQIINRQKLPSLGKSRSVDAVFLVGVAQYLPKKDWFHLLRETKRVLKPRGVLLISCAVDHKIYKWLNIYRLFLPNHFVSRNKIIQQLTQQSFRIEEQYERGLLLTPFFSNILIFFFDAFDKIIFQTKGELGPVGRKMRELFAPLIKLEYSLKLDFGYTLFIVAFNKKKN